MDVSGKNGKHHEASEGSPHARDSSESALGSLTQEKLKVILHYDPLTGIFRWTGAGQKKAGILAGCATKTGYWRIWIGSTEYLAHRLAWLYMTGMPPHSGLDHRNRNRSDNRWSNLRIANHSQNKANCGACRGTATGLKGVTVVRRRGILRRPYRAMIEVAGRTIHLGYFQEAEHAAAVYRIAAAGIFGEFAYGALS